MDKGEYQKGIYSYGGKTTISEGGFVLSGHGEAASWINKNIRVGDTVKIIGGIVSVKR